MRDPFPNGTRNSERIPEVLDAVEEEWREHPDLRLGQLLSNIAGGDPCLLEDDVLMEKLNAEMDADYYITEDDSEV